MLDTRKPRSTYCAIAACLFFLGAGLVLIPHIGIEDDEALFAQAIYHPRYELSSLSIGHYRLPLMSMSYLGALKSWIYWPILRVFGPRVSTVRVPMLLAGVATVWLFFLLLRRVAGARAAVIGCSLLAADSLYLVTTCFDWGPVALQHLLILGGMLLLVKFHQNGGHLALAGGFFLLGLALWDKALAAWMLSGLAVAAVLVFPRQVLRAVTLRRVVVAGLAFAPGALPLIVYNAQNPLATFRGNFRRDTAHVARKAQVLVDTAGGLGLFGFLTAEDVQTPAPHPPQGALQNISARISELAGHPRRSLLLYAFVPALLCAPLAGRNGLRIVLFALAAMAVAWIQMALTADAGASVHHTILLWPLPQMVVAVGFAAVSRRFGRAGFAAVAAVVAALLISGGLVINEYYAVMLRNGGGPAWNNAIFELSSYLKGVPAKYVLCLDWGILDPLRLLNGGTLPLAFGNVEISKPEMSEGDRAAVRRMISGPANVFLAHIREFEVFPGANGKLIDFARATGYERESLALISDPFGRIVFDVYRFGPATP